MTADNLLGTPIKPIKVLGIHDIPLSGLSESEVLDGTVDELPSIIERASELRDAPH